MTDENKNFSPYTSSRALLEEVCSVRGMVLQNVLCSCDTSPGRAKSAIRAWKLCRLGPVPASLERKAEEQ